MQSIFYASAYARTSIALPLTIQIRVLLSFYGILALRRYGEGVRSDNL